MLMVFKRFIFLSLSILFIVHVSYAQKGKMQYVTARMEKTKKKSADMYRLITKNPDDTWRAEYHKKYRDRISYIINYKTKDLVERHGLTREYKNGKLLIDQEYVDGVPHGKCKDYYESGALRYEGEYVDGLQHGKWKAFREDSTWESITMYYHGAMIAMTKAWTKEGLLMWEGNVKDDRKQGDWIYYFANGKKREELHYNKGKKDGEFREWFYNGNIQKEGAYKNNRKIGIWSIHEIDGTLIKRMDYSELPVKILFISEEQKRREQMEVMEGLVEQEMNGDKEDNDEVEDEDEVYMEVETSAEPKGGLDRFRKHISEYLANHYPTEARKEGIEGNVFICFVIEKDGSIGECIILKGIGGGCEEAAIEAIKSYGNWYPPSQGGKLVRQGFNIPIQFRLRLID